MALVLAFMALFYGIEPSSSSSSSSSPLCSLHTKVMSDVVAPTTFAGGNVVDVVDVGDDDKHHHHHRMFDGVAFGMSI